MPPRTNDFQKLVRLIQQSLAPRGAIVTESVMVPDRDGPREVDVMVNTSVGIYKMRIAVEAKDHARKLDKTTLEQIASKYRPGDGVPANLIVVVSRKGFTKSAMAFGQRSRMELLTLREATTADWSKFIRPSIPQFLRFGMAPHLHRIFLNPSVPGDLKKIVAEGRLICACCGRDKGSPLDTIKHHVECHLSHDPKFRKDIDAALKVNGGNALATVRMPVKSRKLRFGGLAYPLTEIGFEIHFQGYEAPLTTKLYEQVDSCGNTRTVQHAEAVVGGKRVQMLLPDGIKSQQITLDISDANPESKACDCEPASTPVQS